MIVEHDGMTIKMCPMKVKLDLVMDHLVILKKGNFLFVSAWVIMIFILLH